MDPIAQLRLRGSVSAFSNLFVHILKHALIQASMESMQRHLTQPLCRISRTLWGPLFEQ